VLPWILAGLSGCGRVGFELTSRATERLEVVIDHRTGTDTLLSFPVLVTLDKARLGGVALDNLQFRDADETTVLPHEIEGQDSTTGTSRIWVRVPRIEAAATNQIWLYLGGTPGTSDPSAVWSAYASVWHLSEQAVDEQASMIHRDSGPSAVDGTQGGNAMTAGIVAGGQRFDGVDDEIIFGAASQLEFAGAISIEAWVRLATPQTQLADFARVVSKWAGDSGGYTLMFSAPPGEILFGVADGTIQDTLYVPATLQPDRWYYLAGTWAPQPSGERVMYLDGQPIIQSASTNSSIAPVPAATSAGSAIGSDWFDGAIDEIRLSHVAHSADWIATQHRSMTGALITYGPKEPVP
jgi:hypothetical protein